MIAIVQYNDILFVATVTYKKVASFSPQESLLLFVTVKQTFSLSRVLNSQQSTTKITQELKNRP